MAKLLGEVENMVSIRENFGLFFTLILTFSCCGLSMANILKMKSFILILFTSIKKCR